MSDLTKRLRDEAADWDENETDTFYHLLKEAADTIESQAAEITELRTLLEIARPFVDSQAQAERMLDGFGPRPHRPIDKFLERIDAAIAAKESK